MAIMTHNSTAKKVTVSIPTELLERLNAYIPKRQRSEFIIEAIKEHLALEEQFIALEESAGAWTDEHHADMKSGEEIDRWLEQLRANWGSTLSTVEGKDGDLVA